MVAYSAAQIVITDDNFSTIVGAVQQGLVVCGNLKKVILYLFATPIDEVVLLALLGLASVVLWTEELRKRFTRARLRARPRA